MVQVLENSKREPNHEKAKEDEQWGELVSSHGFQNSKYDHSNCFGYHKACKNQSSVLNSLDDVLFSVDLFVVKTLVVAENSLEQEVTKVSWKVHEQNYGCKSISYANLSICLCNFNLELPKEVVNYLEDNICYLDGDLSEQGENKHCNLDRYKLIITDDASKEGQHEEFELLSKLNDGDEKDLVDVGQHSLEIACWVGVPHWFGASILLSNLASVNVHDDHAHEERPTYCSSCSLSSPVQYYYEEVAKSRKHYQIY